MFSSITSWFKASDNSTQEAATIEELMALMRSGMQTVAGVPVSIEAAQGLAAYAISVRVISEAIAHLPLVLYRKIGNTKLPAKEDRLYKLLHDSPNPNQTSYQWRKLGLRDLLYRGNWYNFKTLSGKQVVQLDRLHPDTVTPRIDLNTGEKVFDVRLRGGPQTFGQDRIQHIWFDSDDGIIGLDPIKVHRNSIGDSIAVRDHGSKFFKNAARLAGVLQQDATVQIDPEDLRTLLKDFNSMYTGTENAHKTAALPKGFSFKEVSVTPENAQWIEARKTSAREIYGILGVPPHKAGDLADATFSNIEHENLSFVIDSMMPRLVAIEQSIQKDLLDNNPDMFAKFNASALLRGDFKTRQEGLNIQRRAGVINANQWREKEDMNPRDDEGGEEYIVETNMRKQNGDDPENDK